MKQKNDGKVRDSATPTLVNVEKQNSTSDPIAEFADDEDAEYNKPKVEYQKSVVERAINIMLCRWFPKQPQKNFPSVLFFNPLFFSVLFFSLFIFENVVRNLQTRKLFELLHVHLSLRTFIWTCSSSLEPGSC